MLIFTSGTSGEPKAVRVTHRKIAGPGLSMVARGINRDDVAYNAPLALKVKVVPVLTHAVWVPVAVVLV